MVIWLLVLNAAQRTRMNPDSVLAAEALFYQWKARENVAVPALDSRKDTWKMSVFGLPHGGIIVGLFIGLMLVIFGLGNLFGWKIDFGPLVMIVIGVLIVAGALYGLSRRR